MPHLFLSRPRVHQLFQGRSRLKLQHKWETINGICYGVGGILLCLESIFSFPALEHYATLGTWFFLSGSIVYLVVGLHDLLEVLSNTIMRPNKSGIQTRLEFTTAFLYLSGSILYTLGNSLFLTTIDRIPRAANCIICGSVALIVGALINVLQIVKATTLTQLQLLNLTALSFVIGSVLFVVASVPHLWGDDYSHELYDFMAAEYLAGSVLFLFGGICNYGRSKVVLKLLLREIHRKVARVKLDNSYEEGVEEKARTKEELQKYSEHQDYTNQQEDST